MEILKTVRTILAKGVDVVAKGVDAVGGSDIVWAIALCLGPVAEIFKCVLCGTAVP